MRNYVYPIMSKPLDHRAFTLCAELMMKWKEVLIYLFWL